MGWILMAIQLTVTIIIGIYFYKQLRSPKQSSGSTSRKERNKEMDKLIAQRNIKLTLPLNEFVRPKKFSDIIGQEEAIKALKAILCGPNPQHVLIYGPPGVGKTCAARLTLEYARGMDQSPFKIDAPFVEIDATCVRFDERAIADPLIGSVHDPIYQGAGQLGIQGIPQPKPGAVTRAHGGVLFLDEIGELHPVQMNKLLKVLEDRKVMLESAYYNAEDSNVPSHIHDIFKNGLPADFRLIGATTRSPEDLPPALRSRCMEVYFRALEADEVAKIAAGAAQRAGHDIQDGCDMLIGEYAQCGRDAVNIIQVSVGAAQLENRRNILLKDVEWVVETGNYSKRPEREWRTSACVGAVHGLGVFGARQGAVLEVEAACIAGKGNITVSGIIEEEELGREGHKMKRKSMARGSAETVYTLLRKLELDIDTLDVHISFPGGAPVDGPSAGVAMIVAAYSAIEQIPVDGNTAMTGEVTLLGEVRGVGGVPQKIEAAIRAGLSRVIIPKENWMERFSEYNIEICPVSNVSQALSLAMPGQPGIAAKESARGLVAASAYQA